MSELIYPKRLQGVYLITNNDPWSLVFAKLQAAITAGVRIVQYRRKQVPLTEQWAELTQLFEYCQGFKVQLIINDQLEQAAHFGCGLHLGQSDGSLIEARAVLGDQAIIGRTCHNSLGLAERAVAEGASYVAFGAVYPSRYKPNAVRVELETLKQALQQFGTNTPICAIGGLTVENSVPLVNSGIRLLAIVGDIMDCPPENIGPRVTAWLNLLTARGTILEDFESR